MTTNRLTSSVRTWASDRGRVGSALLVTGVIGVVAALAVGVAGWVFAGLAATTVAETVEPIGGVVVDVSESIAASQVLFERTTDAIESIESATRSGVRTADSVGEILTQTATLAGGDIADSLDSAVATLPALISTSRVIDGTMRALSFVGVDYDPDAPLDESLTDLQTSLEPIPGQIRDQAALLEDVRVDLDQIADDGRELSAVLLDTRLEMADAARILDSAAANARSAVESVEAIESQISTYDTLARLIAVAAALALLAAASAPLLIGLHLRADHEPRGHPAT